MKFVASQAWAEMATGCPPESAKDVLETMRAENPDIDQLDFMAFAPLARRAWQVQQIIDGATYAEVFNPMPQMEAA